MMGEREVAPDTQDPWEVSSSRSQRHLPQERHLRQISRMCGHQQGAEEIGREGSTPAKARVLEVSGEALEELGEAETMVGE